MRDRQINDVLEIVKRYFKDYGMDMRDVYFTEGWDETAEIYNENGVEVWFSKDYNYLDILGLTVEEKTEVMLRIADMTVQMYMEKCKDEKATRGE